ncbi:glycosyltransferase family 2 protein [Streptomyces sp. NBC_00249]|uniref:glycosyltransferase family 2 protein n=1 Tax=Streptomyces sp. NBC_00249 TaxID=2975690 RepID=UPI0022536D1F|nr:glycosyltransferase family 2 protein [Streptomyces sp. NBC_00249]MCX5193750.1 glycosyltransferase family 2 protein [Streptomyces sp. NBC_00249]
MATLSVIVAMCNVREYCRTTLKSLALNAREDFEFIIVDDASVDGTSEILREMVPRIPGAVLIRNERNMGISATRNIGVSASRGRFFTFLDGDDWYAPGYLAQLVGWMSQSGVDFLRTGHVRVYGKKRKVVLPPLAPRALPLNPLDYMGPVDASTLIDYPLVWAGIYDRERLREVGALFFDEDLRTAEDRRWFYQLHLRARSFGVVDLHGVFYRRDVSTSLTKIPDERQLDFLPAFQRVFEELAAHPRGYEISFKAMRSLCALVVIHLDRADTYDEHTRGLLLERSAQTLMDLPPDILEGTLAGMDSARVNKIRGLMSRHEGAAAR